MPISLNKQKELSCRTSGKQNHFWRSFKEKNSTGDYICDMYYIEISICVFITVF